MKIGILTFHYAYNYGSALQAYALKTYLESNGHDVEIINYVYELDRKRYNLFRFEQYTKPYKFLVDVLSLRNTYRRKSKYKEFQKKFLEIDNKIVISEGELSDIVIEYDCFICGSDQIWNAECTEKVVPAYFLQFAKNYDVLKASYAPSIAHDKIPEKYIGDFKKYLEIFDFISIREQTGKSILERLTDKKVTQVLDPTLLLDVRYYEKIESKVDVDEKYIFLYTLERKEEIFEYVKQLSEKKGLAVVYFNRFNLNIFSKGINFFEYGPQEFLYLIHKAEYVVTNSFHATVFSILYEKKFTTFTTSRSGSRMRDFLSELVLENRIFGPKHNIDNEIDYVDAKIRLDNAKTKSFDYLQNILSCGKEK